MTSFRVINDKYLGFEVQARRWWHWPFWLQCEGPICHNVNTFHSVRSAISWINELKQREKVVHQQK